MSENKRSSKCKWIIVFIVIVLIIFVLLGLQSCQKDTENQPSNDQTNNVSDDPIQSFYDADQKHGFVEFSSKKGDAPYGDIHKFEYWFDQDQYRITWYHEDGSVRIHMISPDGINLYHCDPEKETSVIAYTGPNFHHWIFNGPEGYTLGDGVDEGEYKVYTYKTDKLWEIEKASQKFYLADLQIYTKDGVLSKIVTRTNSKRVEEAELVYSQYVITKQENNVKYDASLFELPYEIVEP